MYRMFVQDDFISCVMVAKGYEAQDGEMLLDHFATDEELADFAPEVFERMQARRRIAQIEISITPRRLRESVLTEEGRVWLQDRGAEIAQERAKL